MRIYSQSVKVVATGLEQLMCSYDLRLDVFSVNHVHERLIRRQYSTFFSLLLIILFVSSELNYLQDLVGDYLHLNSTESHYLSFCGTLNSNRQVETYF